MMESASGKMDLSAESLDENLQNKIPSENISVNISREVPSVSYSVNRHKNLTLNLENVVQPESSQSRPFYDHEERIPKPHFLDHSPSPEEFDEKNHNFLDDYPRYSGSSTSSYPRTPDFLNHSNYSNDSEKYDRTIQNQLTWPRSPEYWSKPGTSRGSIRTLPRPANQMEAKMDCIQNLLSMLTLSTENNNDELSKTMLEMSRSVENCISMRQSGCIALLVQMIHSDNSRAIKNRAAQALHNIVHTRIDDKAGRKEARVWRLLEQVREYYYYLEDLVCLKNEQQLLSDDLTKHPSQSVAALMKLSFDEEHRHVVCLLGGLQVLSNLVTVDQLAHGSHIEDPTCMTMRKYAGMTLTNLTFGDGNNKSLLCSFKSFMTALVEQLDSPNDDMRQVTSAVLRNLSWRADSNSKQVLREVGAVRGLTLAAMNCQKEATLKSVLSALWNLTAHCSANKVSLCSVDGALGFLVDMLSFNSPNKTLAIIENAGGIMRNVSSHIAVREDYRRILRERNCLSVLLHHLKSPSLTVVSNACGTLWNLSARCPQDQQFLWDHGAVPMLQSLMHSKHKMIAMGSSAALKNLVNSRPAKSSIVTLDTTAKIMNLPALPTLGVRKQKALEQDIDQNLAETCDNIEPANSPTTLNKAEKHLLSATERQIAINLARHRMTSSSPLMSTLSSQHSFNNTPHSVSLSNTLLKNAYYTKTTDNSPIYVNRSDSKDSVTSVHSDSILERVTGKAPIPTPRSLRLPLSKQSSDEQENYANVSNLNKFKKQPPVPPPRNETTKLLFVDSGTCERAIDYSEKYADSRDEITSTSPTANNFDKSQDEEVPKNFANEETESYGDYQETDLDQPTDYSLKYAENGSENFDQPVTQDDTIKTFCTEGTPYETPIVFSTATSITDLRAVGKQEKKVTKGPVKINCEVTFEPDEKDSCSLEQHNNDAAVEKPDIDKINSIDSNSRQFDSKLSSGLMSPEKPVNYCDEGTPGYFSRVSSLSSLEGNAQQDTSAKMDNNLDTSTNLNAKEKEASKSVTFASEEATSNNTDGFNTPAGCVEDTPLMFSRCSSLGSIPGCSGPEHMEDHVSVQSEISQLASGLLSPSEIPDSPGAPLSPRHSSRQDNKDWSERASCLSPLTVDDVNNRIEFRNMTKNGFKTESIPDNDTICSESSNNTNNISDTAILRDSYKTYYTEDTPALLSKVGSNSNLSVLSIETDNEPLKPTVKFDCKTPNTSDSCHVYVIEDTPAVMSKVGSASNLSVLSIETESGSLAKPTVRFDAKTPNQGDACKVYFTEDTPAVMSKVGSNSNLSELSIETNTLEQSEKCDSKKHDSSTDSSNLSDTGENVLAECIEMGIAKVVKNPTSSNSYDSRGHNFKSLPSYLEATYENIGFDREETKSVPPVPKRGIRHTPPPLPPRIADSPLGSDDERIFNMAIQKGISKLKERKTEVNNSRNSSTPIKSKIDRNDSLSSLSVESYGSADREIFEQCVRAGLDVSRHKSLERPRQTHVIKRVNRSLDRKPKDDSDSFSNDSFGSTDREVFEKSVKAGMAKQPTKNEVTPSAVVAPAPAGGDVVEEFGSDKLPNGQPLSAFDGCDDQLDGLFASKVKRSETESTLCEAISSVEEIENILSSKKIENILPDLLGQSSSLAARSIPDLMNDVDSEENKRSTSVSFASIEKEAAQLAAKLKYMKFSTDHMTSSQNSNVSLELEQVKPPSQMGSLLSLSQSLCIDDSLGLHKKDSKGFKKPKPLSILLRGKLTHSLTSRGSSENVDSLIDNVNPPSEMDFVIDLENCVTSSESASSDNDGVASKLCPVAFDFKEPVSDGKFIKNYTNLEEINPPSLFDELIETTLEQDKNFEPSADKRFESLTWSIESTSFLEPQRKHEQSNFDMRKQLTPKQKRQAAKYRFQTYVIKDFSNSLNEDDFSNEETENVAVRDEFYKDNISTSEDVGSIQTENKPKRKLSAKQRRSTDRERYQTQVVNLRDITLTSNDSLEKEIVGSDCAESKADSKKTLKQKRLENSERFKTRTIADDIVTSSPNDSFKDINVDNAETTTGYDSLSSLELSHQALHEEQPLEINKNFTSYMLTYTKTSKVAPSMQSSVIEAKNRHNIELNNSFDAEFSQTEDWLESGQETRTLTKQSTQTSHMKRAETYSIYTDSEPEVSPISREFKRTKHAESFFVSTDSEPEVTPVKVKPKIVKPSEFFTVEIIDTDEKKAKGIRGRAKAPYISPYRQNSAPTKTQNTNKCENVKGKPGLSGEKRTSTPAKNAVKSAPNSPSTSGTPKNLSLVRQGTFTKEETSILDKTLPSIDAKKPPKIFQKSTPSNVTRNVPNSVNPSKKNKTPISSKLPQVNKSTSQNVRKIVSKSNDNTPTKKATSNALVSDEKKGTPRQTSKEVSSKIASLWKKVETSKIPQSRENKVYPVEKKLGGAGKLIRSSTFENPPKGNASKTQIPKQKSSAGARDSQIPGARSGKTSFMSPRTNTLKLFDKKTNNDEML